MMVDSGSTAKREAVVDVLKEKDEAGGYVSGGWKRWLQSFFSLKKNFDICITGEVLEMVIINISYKYIHFDVVLLFSL